MLVVFEIFFREVDHRCLGRPATKARQTKRKNIVVSDIMRPQACHKSYDGAYECSRCQFIEIKVCELFWRI